MVHELSPSRSTLPPVEDWRTLDSRRLRYVVAVNEDGLAKDLTNDSIYWELLRKPYHAREDAILTEESSGVTLQRDGVVDPEAGEFRVDVAEDVIESWGPRWQRVTIDPPDESRQSWLGLIHVVARGSSGDSV